MGRPVTLFTGQWADMKLEDLARRAAEDLYDEAERTHARTRLLVVAALLATAVLAAVAIAATLPIP